MVDKEALKQFKRLYKKEFKKRLSEEEALELANNLIGLYKVVYQPDQNISINQNNCEKVQVKQNKV